MPSHEDRLEVAREVLDGLSVGDAIGEALSYQHYKARESADFSVFRDGTVPYTDDTEMASAVFETLGSYQSIEEDSIAFAYACRFRKDPDRGYGKGARRVLQEIFLNGDWKCASANAFNGGSFGNGTAMRVAPLGAYFADNLSVVVEMAVRSARVTHFHPEGIAGAVAVAVATAVATSGRATKHRDLAKAIWNATIERTPESRVLQSLITASEFEASSASKAAQLLGNGAEISAQDTVPFCIWNACRLITNYREAIISTIEVGGDCDTNCAIVGGIVSAHLGRSGIPSEWLRVREPLRLK